MSAGYATLPSMSMGGRGTTRIGQVRSGVLRTVRRRRRSLSALRAERALLARHSVPYLHINNALGGSRYECPVQHTPCRKSNLRQRTRIHQHESLRRAQPRYSARPLLLFKNHKPSAAQQRPLPSLTPYLTERYTQVDNSLAAYGPCKVLSAGCELVECSNRTPASGSGSGSGSGSAGAQKKDAPPDENDMLKWLENFAFAGVAHGGITTDAALRGGSTMVVAQVGGIVSLENTGGRGIPTGARIAGLPKFNELKTLTSEGYTNRLGTDASRIDIVPVSCGFYSDQETVFHIFEGRVPSDNYFASAIHKLFDKADRYNDPNVTPDDLWKEVSRICHNWNIGTCVKGDSKKQTIDVTLNRSH